jgi:hypothetical protein
MQNQHQSASKLYVRNNNIPSNNNTTNTTTTSTTTIVKKQPTTISTTSGASILSASNINVDIAQLSNSSFLSSHLILGNQTPSTSTNSKLQQQHQQLKSCVQQQSMSTNAQAVSSGSKLVPSSSQPQQQQQQLQQSSQTQIQQKQNEYKLELMNGDGRDNLEDDLSDDYSKLNRVRFSPDDKTTPTAVNGHMSIKKTVSIISPIHFLEADDISQNESNYGNNNLFGGSEYNSHSCNFSSK